MLVLNVGDYVQFRNGDIGMVKCVRDYSEDDKYKFDVCRLNSEGYDIYGANGEFWINHGEHELDIMRVIDLRDIDRLAALYKCFNASVEVDYPTFLQAIDTYLLP